MPTFTVDEILTAAEKNKYRNFNDTWIEYENRVGDMVWVQDKTKPIRACVIGEAFLNLGLVENGIDAEDLSTALQSVHPDEGEVEIMIKSEYNDYYPVMYTDLSEFINSLNGIAGYKGKKRIVKLARKYFSKSLNQEVTFGDYTDD